MRDFDTIYEYSFSGSAVWHIIPIFMFVLIGFGIVYSVKKYFTQFSYLRQILQFVGWWIGGITSIIFVIFLIKIPSKLDEEKDFKEMIAQKSYSIVEGFTENYIAPYESTSHFESFTVNGVKFKYSDYVIVDGFHKTSNSGGPIKGDSLLVRIGYTEINNENVILKLEISK